MALRCVRSRHEQSRGRHSRMARRDPDPQCRRATHELERWVELDGLTVDPAKERFRGTYLDRGRGPRPSRPASWVARRVEDDDPEAPAGEGGAGAGHQGAIKRVGLLETRTTAGSSWSRPRSSAMCSCEAARLGPSTACAVSSRVRSFASRYPGRCTVSP